MENLVGRQKVMKKREAELLTSEYLVRFAMTMTNSSVKCERCGFDFPIGSNQLPSEDYYCPACINFGRVTSSDFLISCSSLEKSSRSIDFSWSGQLTAAQKQIADQVVENFEQKENSLIWAVTGSGKTEMIFPVVADCLRKGGRVAIASPRIDVCRELFPRFSAVFPKEKTLLLYGDSAQDYYYSDLTICTTHQLLHFFKAFDLLIIDEIDAFPYDGDPLLDYAQKQAVKDTGQKIYLTATPPAHLLSSIAGDFHILKLPLRFHQRPLVVPQVIWYEKWQYAYQTKGRIKKLVSYLKKLVKDNNVLVFCPSIALMKCLFKKVVPFFPAITLAQVCSQDAKREEKVENMRQGAYQILFCTNILERGVTFENVSVIVMGANHEIYSKSALVQIAGRVDRKGQYHHGQVIYFYDQYTKAIKAACLEIKQMNQLARKWVEK